MVGGAILASQSAFGQFTANNLYLGFQNAAGSASSDYIINLGAASSIVGGYAPVDLTSAFSLGDFNSVLGGSSSIYFGVVGGYNNATGPSDIYLTQLRTGNLDQIGTLQPNTAGSSVSALITKSGINGAVSTLNQLILPTAGTGALDSSKSWENYIEPANTGSTFIGNTGINPDSSIAISGGTGLLYEDLWSAAKNGSGSPGPYTYVGYLALDINGASSSLIFTPAAVPEPATCSLIGGGSLLLLALRRRSLGKQA